MGSCLSCCRSRSREREPLLPKSVPSLPPPLPPPHSPLDKLVDVLAGFQAGKLPSQEQLEVILRSVLCSDLLKDDPQFLSGPLSGNGKRVVADLNEALEATLQFGIEKNMDDRFQELVHQFSHIEGPPIHADIDTAIEAGHQGLAQLQAEAPTRIEILHDATALITSFRAITRLLITSAAFRLLLSDMFSSTRAALAQVASEVGTIAQQVQVAAKGIERAAKVEGGSLSILPGKMEEAVKGVREGVEEASAKSRSQDIETTKDTFIARVQDLVVRAHQDPRNLKALRALLTISRKHARKLSQTVAVVSKIPTVISGVSVTPMNETFQTLENIKILFERLASGHSLDTLLHALANTANSFADNIESSSKSDPDLQLYLASVDHWLSHALDPEQPLYATSRRGTRALENIYDEGYILFISSSASSSTSPWSQHLRSFLEAYDAYSTALANDSSTTRLLRSLSALHFDLSNFVALSIGVDAHIQKQKDEFIRDLLGWLLPRVINLVGRIGLLMPGVEYKSGEIAVALDALKMGPRHAGGVLLDIAPDQVVVMTSNEVRVDMREDARRNGTSMSRSSRLQVHVDGIRVAVRELGYFVMYGNGVLGYSDQGLLSFEVGGPKSVHLDSGSQGLSLDLGLSLDTGPSKSESDPATPARLFDVLDVKATLSGVRFMLSKSKHWIMNKVFVQPLAGPLVSRIAARLLEAKIRTGLEKLSSGLAIVMDTARKSHDEETGSVGLLDYWEALSERGLEAFGVASAAGRTGNAEVETCSRTTANLKGVVHTITTVASGSSSQEPETSVAIGGGTMLFPDKAGAYEGEDNDAGMLERVVQGVEDAVDEAEIVVESVVESAAEVRGELERVEERRQETKKLESLKDGWRSRVFDLC
ncbi:hypothetical protein H0H87_012052 [Tephrocybe sp. NHM501043]|nr:hypothetical protein H0H87_012052 [Tephrocybe sp. NHM501043]